MTADQVPVWIVDDQDSFRRVAVEMLATASEFIVAGQCASGEAAIERLDGYDGDNGDDGDHGDGDHGDGSGGRGIVLMDIHMPGIGGIEATRRICAAHPDLTVLLMSTYNLEDLPADTTDCGAAAYLLKEDLTADLLTRLSHGGRPC